MTKYKLGDTVMANGWPAVVIEANRSEGAYATVMCAVFGWEIDYGSVYVRDVYAVPLDAALAGLDTDKHAEFKRVHAEYTKKREKKEAAKARAAARKEAK